MNKRMDFISEMHMSVKQSTESFKAAQQLIFRQTPNKFPVPLVDEGPLPCSRLPALVSHLRHKHPVLTLTLYPHPVLILTLYPYPVLILTLYPYPVLTLTLNPYPVLTLTL
jgi:hypothetical protein